MTENADADLLSSVVIGFDEGRNLPDFRAGAGRQVTVFETFQLFANLANGLEGFLEDGRVLAQEVEDTAVVERPSLKVFENVSGVVGFDEVDFVGALGIPPRARESGRLRIREVL